MLRPNTSQICTTKSDVFLLPRHFDLLCERHLVAQGQRHLPQLIVEERRAFLNGLSIREPAGDAATRTSPA